MDDYISREYLLKEIKAFFEKDRRKKYRTLRERRERKRYTQIFEIGVKHFPAADVEPVTHGKWLPQIFLGQRVWDCSECKTMGSPQWKRCPVCEAKMDGE